MKLVLPSLGSRLQDALVASWAGENVLEHGCSKTDVTRAACAWACASVLAALQCSSGRTELLICLRPWPPYSLLKASGLVVRGSDVEWLGTSGSTKMEARYCSEMLWNCRATVVSRRKRTGFPLHAMRMRTCAEHVLLTCRGRPQDSAQESGPSSARHAVWLWGWLCRARSIRCQWPRCVDSTSVPRHHLIYGGFYLLLPAWRPSISAQSGYSHGYSDAQNGKNGKNGKGGGSGKSRNPKGGR